MRQDARAIAFYLPQFHPDEYNDRFWGTGFTDWQNVVRARPAFPGHQQPRFPTTLGFYDLRVPEVRLAQEELARDALVDAFCYYHYWFDGERPLRRPVDDRLADTASDGLPFLLCWANENWTRTWDGQEAKVLLAQRYDSKTIELHARWLAEAFGHPRYQYHQNRPLFLVFRASLLPEPLRYTEAIRVASTSAGLPEPFLCRVESSVEEGGNPETLGFDGAVVFEPRWTDLGRPSIARYLASAYNVTGPRRVRVRPYQVLADSATRRPAPPYVTFPCVTPAWDNSPRRPTGATIFHGAEPSIYEAWLRRTAQQHSGPIFINAWNEWAEGAVLEPDSLFGRSWLEATARALSIP